MRFTVGIVGHDTVAHARCFEDFAAAVADALRTLGHEIVQPRDVNVDGKKPGRLVMFGSNNLNDTARKLPADSIVYNSEQISAVTNSAFLIQNFKQYQRHVVWDYSEANIKRLHEMGIKRAVHCPVAYIPSMTKIKPAVVEDIDVLFYGSVNAHRRKILDALDSSGLRVVRLFNVYGEERDAVIARSKIVVNLHYYENAVFEIFRVSHLLANRKCVVTEAGGQDTALEDFARSATSYVPADRVVEACRELVKDDAARRALADKGFEAFKARDLVSGVEKAIAQSVMDTEDKA